MPALRSLICFVPWVSHGARLHTAAPPKENPPAACFAPYPCRHCLFCNLPLPVYAAIKSRSPETGCPRGAVYCVFPKATARNLCQNAFGRLKRFNTAISELETGISFSRKPLKKDARFKPGHHSDLGRKRLATLQSSCKANSAAASAWISALSNTGSGQSCGFSSRPISVQPKITPCAPSFCSSPITRR
ncbi:hypothetical protein AABM17_1943 [Neisseria musculi]|uniref:Uncharacterized protein n=1 Tax=Neisseria musculi TaxID=1815583 RepID=A0A7H1MFC0_9NEIS|nr:hypothetical protein H7A79_1941 [Neisseria musculi]